MATFLNFASKDNKNFPPPPLTIGPVSPQHQNQVALNLAQPTVVYQAQPTGAFPSQGPTTDTTETQQDEHTTPQQEGFCTRIYKTIPIMPMWCAVLLLIANIILPGLGTIVAGFTVYCCAQLRHGQTTGNIRSQNVLNGLNQMWLFFIFVPLGWIWAFVWGVFFITVSAKKYGKPDSIPPSSTIQAQFTQDQVPNSL